MKLKRLYRFFIGTYTDGTESRGIYSLHFDPDSGTAECKEAARVSNPSCLSVLNGVLYAGSEAQDRAVITAYEIEDDTLSLRAERALHGKGLCHLSVSQEADAVFASCLFSGNLFLLEPKDLRVRCALSLPPQEGRQAWVHCGVCSGNGDLLMVADMAGDRILAYPIRDGGVDPAGSPLICGSGAGSGPRHIAFHPKGNWIYTANECDSTVGIFSLEGGLHLVQTVPSGQDKVEGTNYPASIVPTADGNWVLVSNRGQDTVSVWSVLPGGTLRNAGDYPCYGKWPRHMTLTGDMRYLVISNQHTNTVVLCPFRLSDGSIGPPACEAAIPAPSWAVEV